MVEFIEILHVSEDDVLLVDDSWRNLLNTAGHLPQVGLHGEKKYMMGKKRQKQLNASKRF